MKTKVQKKKLVAISVRLSPDNAAKFKAKARAMGRSAAGEARFLIERGLELVP